MLLNQKKSTPTRARLPALACSLILCLAVIASWPFTALPWGDDFSYMKSALDFANTGHFHYNGWAAAMLGWLIPWGALFIKVFGFSFNVLRFSMLPIAAACAFLYQRILLKFGLSQSLAVFGSLTLTLSPLFFLLSTTFMTDIPGLFVILVCIWSCQKAIEARNPVPWLIFAAASNVLGGTVRQIAWMGAIAMVPSVALLLRRFRAGAVIWLLSIAGIEGFSLWFKHQPYSIRETLLPVLHGIPLIRHCGAQVLRTLLTTLLTTLPALVAWLPFSWETPRRRVVTTIAIAAAFAYFIHRLDWLAPWLVPVLFPPALWIRLGATVVVAFASLVFSLALLQNRSAVRGFLSSQATPICILVPFTFGCSALLLLRAAMGMVQDRYILVLLPCALTFLLLLYQRFISREISALCLSTLVLLTYWSVAANHDTFKAFRAKQQAIDTLVSRGVSPTSITLGIARDGWVQVANGGHINDNRIAYPEGSYDPNIALPNRGKGCDDWFAPYTPIIQSKYSISDAVIDCPGSSVIGTVPYSKWIPPFHGQVLTQSLP